MSKPVVEAEIILQLHKLHADLKKLNTTFGSYFSTIEKKSSATAQKMTHEWSAGYALMSIAGVRFAKKITDGFIKVNKVFADYQQALQNTLSITARGGEISKEVFDSFDEAARRVGATTRSTAAQAANALYYLASAGFTAKEAVASLDGVNALAIATASDLAKTTETVATTIRQYNLQAGEATRVANVFTAAITNSLGTMDKLTKSFQYIGPIAGGLGISLEETTGALQLLYNKGFTGEKAGRGLRSILVDLADSSSLVNRRLARLGITFNEVNPAANTLASIMDVLREKGVDATNAAAIFGKVSGVQLAALVAQASDAAGGLQELTDNVTNTNRALETMDIQMDTLQGSVDKFKNANEALRITIGKELEPVFRDLIDTGTGFLAWLGKLPPTLTTAVSAIGTTVAAGLSLSTAIYGIGAALHLAFPPFAIISAAILGVTTLTIGLIGTIGNLRKQRISSLTEEFEAVAKATGVAADNAMDFYKKAEKFKASLGSYANAINPWGNYDTATLTEKIKQLAKAYGITYEQAVRLAATNDYFVQSNKENFATIYRSTMQEVKAREDQIAVEKELFRQRANEWLEEERRLKARALQEEEDEEAAENRERNIKEAYASLKVAFERSAHYAAVLGDEYNRNDELLKAYKKSLRLLIDQDLPAEGVEVQELIKLWEELQKEKGAVNDTSSDLSKRLKIQEELDTLLAQIATREALAKKEGREYNAELERSNAILAAREKLIELSFSATGAGMTAFMLKYGQGLALNAELLADYTKRKEELFASNDKTIAQQAEMLNKERELTLAKVATDDAMQATKDTINEYYDALIAGLAATDIADYEAKVEQLQHSELELLIIQRDRAIENAKGSQTLIDLIDAYYTKLIAVKKLEQSDKERALALEINKLEKEAIYNATLSAQTKRDIFAVDLELLSIEEEKELAAAETAEEIELVRQKYRLLANELEKKTEIAIFKDFKEQASSLINSIESTLTSIASVFEAYYTKLAELEQANLERQIADIDAREQAELASLGLLEETKREQYNRELAEAITAMDAEAEAAARTNLQKLDIAERYEAERIAANEEAERKIADAKYKADVAAYYSNLTSAIASGIVAVLNAYSMKPWPVGLAAGLAATVATGAQVTKLRMNKPVPPAFEDGGIVPGSSYTGDKVLSRLNSGEVVLNQAQTKNVASKLMAQETGTITITVPVYLDGKLVAESTGRYFKNNGALYK